ncbi:PepSY domain-containing protein [Croceicoccus bisphenolivorans]|uniref:PepSY domain-containing protein n=1 Tax=Croceicoccus bisphenolivorans TaxID=1783232 RepID=UPI00082BF5FC|nr:PepSY domain-containing protein [Croceicoccus bisphenolivorans]
MRILKSIHTWLGWLIAVPLLLWTISGLVMVAKPEAETKGEHYRLNAAARALPPGWLAAQLIEGEDRPVEMRTRMQGNSAVTSAIYSDGKIERYFAKSGEPVPEIDLAAARTIVAMEIAGGDKVDSVRFFEAENTPGDFGRKVPVWQVVLRDGTNVYVGRESGDIEAIRTPWWRTNETFRNLHTLRGNVGNIKGLAYGLLAVLAILLLTSLTLRRREKSQLKADAPITAPESSV